MIKSRQPFPIISKPPRKRQFANLRTGKEQPVYTRLDNTGHKVPVYFGDNTDLKDGMKFNTPHQSTYSNFLND